MRFVVKIPRSVFCLPGFAKQGRINTSAPAWAVAFFLRKNKGGKILSSPWGSDFASQNKEDL